MSPLINALGDMRARWVALIRKQGWGDQFDGDIQNIDDAIAALSAEPLPVVVCGCETCPEAEYDNAEAGMVCNTCGEEMRELGVELKALIDGYAELHGEDDCATEQAVYLAEYLVEHSKAIVAAISTQVAAAS